VRCAPLTVARLDAFAPLEADWKALLRSCPCDTIFLTWDWQQLWWRAFPEGELHLLAVRADDELVGIAPLVRQDDCWGLAGGAEVADFLDVIAHPVHRTAVAEAVLDYLDERGGQLVLRNLRPDSLGATALLDEARRRGMPASLEQEDVSPRLVLPGDWEEYLQDLTKKDRHELRRKQRRLYASGEVGYGAVAPGDLREADVADFVRLHRLSGEAKADFMTAAMEDFFGAVLRAFVPRGWARLYFLTVDGGRAAATILFDYGGEFLLYNSGYDPAYAHLSVGLLLKAFCIRDAIAERRRAFDFLQGNEPYKYDLGGVDTPIYRLCLGLASPRAAARNGCYV
jgi:CelD/BcsL family acetyltransferase involved in cellulose biosynthesis